MAKKKLEFNTLQKSASIGSYSSAAGSSVNVVDKLPEDETLSALVTKNAKLTAAPKFSTGGTVVANPQKIIFREYAPSQVYYQYLKVTNRTCHSVRFRVSIPATLSRKSYFSIRLVSTPQNADGLVAPGMSCRYKVSFHPDSAANFESRLRVDTELAAVPLNMVPFVSPPLPFAGERITPLLTEIGAPTNVSFAVPLLAQREAPELTLPEYPVTDLGRVFEAIRKWEDGHPWDPEIEPLPDSISAGPFEVSPSLRSAISIDGSSALKYYSGQESKYPKLEFGGVCQLFENRTHTLAVRNLSPMRAPFRAFVQRYAGDAIEDASSEPDQNEGGKAADAGRGGLLLRRTRHEKIGFTSAVGRAWIDSVKDLRRNARKMHNVLRGGLGAAFHVSPSTGVLEPWQELRVTVTAYNNLVGTYEDNLVVELGEWSSFAFPLSMAVEGVPVKLGGAQVVKAVLTSDVDQVTFGTRLMQIGPRTADSSLADGRRMSTVGGSRRKTRVELDAGRSDAELVVTKFCKVENLSPKSICISWEIHPRVHASAIDVTEESRNPSPPRRDSVTQRKMSGEAFGLGGFVRPFEPTLSRLAEVAGDYAKSQLTIRAIEPDALGSPLPPAQPDDRSPVRSLIGPFSAAGLALSFSASKPGTLDAVVAGTVRYVHGDGRISLDA
ncbi:Deleted in lung and esophageal cancer protein 1, partial [Cladochytrium tenue]